MSFWNMLKDQGGKGNFSFFILLVNILQSLIAVAALIIAILAFMR